MRVLFAAVLVSVIVVVVTMIMAMPVPMMVVMTIAAMLVLVGFLVQPALHVGGLGLGIVKTGIQDLVGVDLAAGNGVERRTGVELVQVVGIPSIVTVR